MCANNFQCDDCGGYFPAQQRKWRDGDGGWELCSECARIAAEADDELPNCVWRGAEFPFAENH